jgi:hypothetical protein
MNDPGPTLGSIDPSWLEQGADIIGDFGVPDYSEGEPGWDTTAWSRMNDVREDLSPPGSDCMGTAGDPPGSGTWILGSIDGTCQWIDTTSCP